MSCVSRLNGSVLLRLLAYGKGECRVNMRLDSCFWGKRSSYRSPSTAFDTRSALWEKQCSSRFYGVVAGSSDLGDGSEEVRAGQYWTQPLSPNLPI